MTLTADTDLTKITADDAVPFNTARVGDVVRIGRGRSARLYVIAKETPDVCFGAPTPGTEMVSYRQIVKSRGKLSSNTYAGHRPNVA